MVDVTKFPQLRMLLWNRPGTTKVTEQDALALYEANWRHVDAQHMGKTEKALVDQLTHQFGHGVLLV